MKEIYVQPNINVTALDIENGLMAGTIELNNELNTNPALVKPMELEDDEWEDAGLSEGSSTNLWTR